MLTYMRWPGLTEWEQFLTWVPEQLTTWGVRHWCATLEVTRAEGLHVHLYVQFTSARDRTTVPFFFEGLRPRADKHDLCGEGLGGRKVQESINRGFFYVWADKASALVGNPRARRAS